MTTPQTQPQSFSERLRIAATGLMSAATRNDQSCLLLADAELYRLGQEGDAMAQKIAEVPPKPDAV